MSWAASDALQLCWGFMAHTDLRVGGALRFGCEAEPFFPRTCRSVRALVSPEARRGVWLPREPRDLSCRRAEWPALLFRVVAGHLWASVNSPCTRALSVSSARGQKNY